MEGDILVERREFHPGGSNEKGQKVNLTRAGQDNWYHAESIRGDTDSSVNRSPHFLMLPGPNTTRPNKNTAGGRGIQRLLDPRLPEFPGDKIPHVNPDAYAFAPELPCKELYGLPVIAVVRQENVAVAFHLGYDGNLFHSIPRALLDAGTDWIRNPYILGSRLKQHRQTRLRHATRRRGPRPNERPGHGKLPRYDVKEVKGGFPTA